MTERAILMSGGRVRDILEGRKTQTRRVIAPQPTRCINDWTHDAEAGECVFYRGELVVLRQSKGINKRDAGELTPVVKKCPYGKPGDILWVREAWGIHRDYEHIYEKDRKGVGIGFVGWRADEGGCPATLISRWRTAIHMPRRFCRLTLNVVDVRVQRLQDISEDDAMAEGCAGVAYGEGPSGSEGILPSTQFAALWDSINGKQSWASNPFVWAIMFDRNRKE